MTWTPTLFVHVLGGIVAIASGWVALAVRKGSHAHRVSGVAFVIAMICMGLAGAYLAFTTMPNAGNVLAGSFAVYLVSSAWLTVKRKPMQTGRAELAMFCLGMTVAICFAALAWYRIRHHDTAALYVVPGIIAFLSSAGDLRMIVRGGIAGSKRIARHLWRMGFALFVATASFFVGGASDPTLQRTGLRARLFTKAVRDTHLPIVPVLIVIVLTVYWLVRVRRTPAMERAHE